MAGMLCAASDVFWLWGLKVAERLPMFLFSKTHPVPGVPYSARQPRWLWSITASLEDALVVCGSGRA